MGLAVALSVSRRSLWGSRSHRVALIEGAISVHPHKGDRVAEFNTYGSPSYQPGEGQSSVSGQEWAEDRENGPHMPTVTVFIRWSGTDIITFSKASL